ncbi:hypothetical protein [Spartinivicinus ruber]|uniref:hypothetical protein n=1 Tax=Spartinivicinus ruber TaxID=2683272 RepID=UPI0013D77364|nr:hypothetical protein [Spartinivicinus ruber]
MKAIHIKTPMTLGNVKEKQAAVIVKANAPLQALASKVMLLHDNYIENKNKASAQTILDLRVAFNKHLQQNIHCCVVHPYQHTVGEGEGHHRYLSAPNAIKALQQKYQDKRDLQQPHNSQAAIVVLVTASHLTPFYQTLTAFNQVMPIPELQQLTRRVKALIELETTKWEQPKAPQMPYWRQLQLTQWQSPQNYLKQLGATQAAIEAMADDQSPKAILTELITKKRQYLTQLNQTWQQTTQTLQDVVGQYLMGNISQQLTQLSVPGHDQVLTAGVLLAGTTDALQPLKEAFNL